MTYYTIVVLYRRIVRYGRHMPRHVTEDNYWYLAGQVVCVQVSSASVQDRQLQSTTVSTFLHNSSNISAITARCRINNTATKQWLTTWPDLDTLGCPWGLG